MITNRMTLCGAALFAGWLLVPGCSSGDGPEDATGTAQAAVTNVPSDGTVACIAITSTGSWSTTQSFDVTPGQSSVFTLDGIPVGTVRFDGAAFSTPCASVTPSSAPTWVSTPVLASVVPGQPTLVTLALHQAGGAGVGVDFDPEPACRSAGLPCFSGAECCSGSCSANNTCQAGPMACGAGLTLCGGACVDLSADPSHCGACGLSCPPGAACTNGACFAPQICGDGLVQGSESCDDGNNVTGDGCSSICQVEAGYVCFGQPTVCSATCGDGVVAGAESCDDANNASGDGCDASCNVEGGFTCFGQPSVCTGPTCVDALWNGMETDVDCGGGACVPCSSGHSCIVGADCQTGVCVAGICQ